MSKIQKKMKIILKKYRFLISLKLNEKIIIITMQKKIQKFFKKKLKIKKKNRRNFRCKKFQKKK